MKRSLARRAVAIVSLVMLTITVFFWIRGQLRWCDIYTFTSDDKPAYQLVSWGGGVAITSAVANSDSRFENSSRGYEGERLPNTEAIRLFESVRIESRQSDWFLMIPYWMMTTIWLAIFGLTEIRFFTIVKSIYNSSFIRRCRALPRLAVCSVLCALIFISAAVMWVRVASGAFDESIRLPPFLNLTLDFVFTQSSVIVEATWFHDSDDLPTYRKIGHSYYPRPFDEWRTLPFAVFDAGFVEDDRVNANATAFFGCFPYWLIVLLSSIAPALWLRARYRERRDKKLFEEAVASKRAEQQNLKSETER